MPYEILIDRYQDEEGLLTYLRGDEIFVETPCWFDSAGRIPRKTYRGCSKTHLPLAFDIDQNGERHLLRDTQWQAIVIPNVRGYREVFLHQGTSPADAKGGCIVLPWADLMKIWSDVTPMEGKNVVIDVNNF
jgi:hypothetical protein